MSFGSRKLRDALSKFATGVCVVTSSPEGFRPFGLTVNSFAPVSLDPPLVLWSLRKSSDTVAAFSAATHYTVNVLDEGQRQLSRKFCNRLQHELAPGEYFEGIAGSPVLNGTLASFECEIVARHNAGDHIIYVGRVIDLRQANSGKPLLFYGGAYQELIDAK